MNDLEIIAIIKEKRRYFLLSLIFIENKNSY